MLRGIKFSPVLLALVLSACGGNPQASPSTVTTTVPGPAATVTATTTAVVTSVPSPVTATETVSLTSTVTSTVTASTSKATPTTKPSASQPGPASGQVQYEKAMKAAGQKPDFATASKECGNMKAERAPYDDGDLSSGGLYFAAIVRDNKDDYLDTLAIEIATLCPQFKAGLAQARADVAVTYTVTGQVDRASVTYSTVGASFQQEANVKLPWKKTVSGAGGFTYRTLSAQNESDDTGSITCTITIGRDVAATATSSGGYSVVSCAP